MWSLSLKCSKTIDPIFSSTSKVSQLLMLTKLEVALALTAGCNSSSNQQPARSVLMEPKRDVAFGVA